jgi:hypothetical protein
MFMMLEFNVWSLIILSKRLCWEHIVMMKYLHVQQMMLFSVDALLYLS